MAKRRLVPCPRCGLTMRRREAKLCGPCYHRKLHLSDNPHTVRSLSSVEAAWIGALFEGEGYFNIRPDRRFTVQLGVGSTEVETIATLLRLVGDGGVYHEAPLPKREGRPHSKKDMWKWSLQRRSAVIALLKQVTPYLTGKQVTAQGLLVRAERLRKEWDEKWTA